MPATAQKPPPPADLVPALHRQVDILIEQGYPQLAGVAIDDLRDRVSALEPLLANVPPVSSETNLPFVLVVSRELVRSESAMELVVDPRGKRGVVDMTPVSPADFEPRPGTVLPTAALYLLADIDLGADFLNVRPIDALGTIEARGRHPLTIDEGIAVMTQYPDALQTHNPFQLLESRGAGKRIPSIWVSYKRPRLGWCWDGAPHTWMGSASAAIRLS